MLRHAVAVAVLLLVAAAPARATQPRCFGAASRDVAHRCRNPALRFSVAPTPAEAPLTVNSPCRPIEVAGACEFGVPARRALATVALLGDSHADQWRAAVDTVARARHWRAVSFARPTCPFSSEPASLPWPGRPDCEVWNVEVQLWLLAHPEVTTAFVSGHAWWRGPQPAEQQAMYDALVAGYMEAWTALPATVQHVIAIRDDPFDYVRTPSCVEHELALRRRPPGVACAVPRSRAIGIDPAMVAAHRLSTPRVTLVDFTQYFCGARFCFPVVGGVLVHRDIDHLTRLFVSTVGPYLLDDVDRLVPAQPFGPTY